MMPMLNGPELMRLAITEAMKIRAQVVENRQCWCGRPAWYRNTYPDGSKEYQCCAGDITIVHPPVEIAR